MLFGKGKLKNSSLSSADSVNKSQSATVLAKVKKFLLITSGVVLLIAICFAVKIFFNFVGDPSRADEIFQQALKDYNAQNYSNAYFQFSKVSYLSDLKPYAIYHRAECAKALNDFKSEQKQYYLLFNVYPNNELSLKAKYLYASEISEENPKLAQKYYEEIIQKYPDSDYATGAEYRLAALLNTKYNESSASTLVDKKEIENLLRNYLTKAPTGKWALKTVDLWLNLGVKIEDEDKNLIAETYFAYNLLDRAEDLLEDTNFNNSWEKKAKLALLKKEYGKTKSLIESGLKQKNSKVKEDSRRQIISRFIKTQKDKEKIADDFLKAASNSNDMFLKLQKCRYSTNKSCYASLIKYYETYNYTEAELTEIFVENITDYSKAKELGLYYLKTFPSGSNAPLIKYWLGRIYKSTGNTVEANEYFKNVIIDHPDSYYAFRSYLQLNSIKNSIITTMIEPKEVLFPYYGKASATIIKLVENNDYDLLSQIYEKDKFVQSWILYEKGEKSRAMCIARDAMQDLEEKPEKTDLRWRLVYPTFLYENMKTHAKNAGNNAVLMLSLTREESYFNPNAQSYVGAVGLMQLMPSTAKEINRIKNVGLENIEELKDPETNMKLGNYYYNFLLNNLGSNNILAIASYNGGIGSINRWKKGLDYRDIDEFIEKIPYTETRNYVKKVFRTYWNYTRIYL